MGLLFQAILVVLLYMTLQMSFLLKPGVTQVTSKWSFASVCPDVTDEIIFTHKTFATKHANIFGYPRGLLIFLRLGWSWWKWV